MADVESPKEAPLVASVIDDIGVGFYQVKEAVLSGCVWLADGAELLLIGSVTRAVAEDWNLSPLEKGAVVSIVFVGVAIGNWTSGPFSDRFGRRWPVIISYAGVGIFSILSAFTLGFWSLSCARLFVGMAFGFGQPATLSYTLEISPTAWRTFLYSFSGYLFIAGEAYSALIILLDDPSMKHLDWRWLLIMGAYPAIVLTFLAVAFLHESPSWLASHGREEEARAVLEKMKSMNGNDTARLEFRTCQKESNNASREDFKRDLGIIFGPAMLYSTLVSCFTCFSLNFLYYGGLYAFPQVLGEQVKTGSSPAIALLIGALWEAPGYVVATVLDKVMDRRPTLMFTQLVLVSCVQAFVYGGTREHESGLNYYLVHYGYAGYKGFASINFLVAYQYAGEIYPVSCRVAGTALSIGVGRAGAVLTPLAYELTRDFFDTWTTFFHILTAILLLNAILVAFLPFETRGKVLRDDGVEGEETDPLCACLERSKYS